MTETSHFCGEVRSEDRFTTGVNRAGVNLEQSWTKEKVIGLIFKVHCNTDRFGSGLLHGNTQTLSSFNEDFSCFRKIQHSIIIVPLHCGLKADHSNPRYDPG